MVCVYMFLFIKNLLFNRWSCLSEKTMGTMLSVKQRRQFLRWQCCHDGYRVTPVCSHYQYFVTILFQISNSYSFYFLSLIIRELNSNTCSLIQIPCNNQPNPINNQQSLKKVLFHQFNQIKTSNYTNLSKVKCIF